MLYESEPLDKVQAFAFILGQDFQGVILSGTKDARHLRENWLAFREASESLR
jgi:aryl-alcohol dehydrogenase-like predicted oxidoreductase